MPAVASLTLSAAAVGLTGCTLLPSGPNTPAETATLRVSYTDEAGPHTFLIEGQSVSCTVAEGSAEGFQHVQSGPDAPTVFTLFLGETTVKTVSIGLGDDLYFTSTEDGEVTDGSFTDLKGAIAQVHDGKVTPGDTNATASGQIGCS